jgi:uncharacterized damage-inducible protein DinB
MKTEQSLSLIKHFQMLARYNTLANQRLYKTCSQLSRSELHRFRPAFFGSIYATLNQILIDDRLWLARFAGQTVPSHNLNEIYENFSDLQLAREIEDGRIEQFSLHLTQESLSEQITYINNEGKLYRDPVDLLVAHFFNHQTHHRGQIHDMISQTEISPPVLDLHRVLRPNPIHSRSIQELSEL